MKLTLLLSVLHVNKSCPKKKKQKTKYRLVIKSVR